MKILIVEDQEKMAKFLETGLAQEGYDSMVADCGKKAEELVSKNPFDLVILDVMLPDQDGFTTAKNIRQRDYHGPILMLTALSTTKDKVQGLDAGADDYLTKPYDFEELLARVRALLRRKSNSNSRLKYGGLELDLIHHKAHRAQQEIGLTSKEFTLLEFLMRNPEKPLERSLIAKNVWNIDFDSESNVIDVYINLLRKKIDTIPGKRLIHTVVGVGYVLKQ